MKSMEEPDLENMKKSLVATSSQKVADVVCVKVADIVPRKSSTLVEGATSDQQQLRLEGLGLRKLTLVEESDETSNHVESEEKNTEEYISKDAVNDSKMNSLKNMPIFGLSDTMQSQSSPLQYEKISQLTKMSSASLIYKKKMERLMHSIKIQCVCDSDCECNEKHRNGQECNHEGPEGEDGRGLRRDLLGELFYGDCHREWQGFVGAIAFFHQLKYLKSEQDYVPSRWRIRHTDNQLKIDDVIQIGEKNFTGNVEEWIQSTTFCIVESTIQEPGCISIKTCSNGQQ